MALSWPLMLTNAIEMAMSLTNLAMIGRISPEALAASTLAVGLYNVLLLFGLGVTTSVSALISREVGRAGVQGAPVRRIVQQGLWGAMAICGPLWIVLWNSAAIFRTAGQEPRLSAEAVTYLHSLQWAIAPALAYLVLRSLFAALERTGWVVVTGIVAVSLNAVLNWVLIGGHLGLPALGLAGSGLATVLSNAFMAVSLAIIATCEGQFRPLRLFAGLRWPDWTGFGAFWRLGLPVGISLVLETGMFGGAAFLVGWIDATALAAHAIALQVASFTFMVPLGVAQAATVRVGRAFGAGDRDAVARAGWTALALGVAVMAVSAVVLMSVPRPIIGLFIRPWEPGAEAVTALAVTLLWIAGLFQIADGAQVVLSGMLRGLHQTRVPMLISAIGYWCIGLPLAALLAFRFHLLAPGVWIGLTTALFAVAGLLFTRWLNLLGRWPSASYPRRTP